MSGGRGSSSSNPSDHPEEEENASNQEENPSSNQEENLSSNRGSRGSSSSNSDQPEEGENPSTQGRGRRTADRQTTSEEDVDLAEVLAYLLRRWGGVGSP